MFDQMGREVSRYQAKYGSVLSFLSFFSGGLLLTFALVVVPTHTFSLRLLQIRVAMQDSKSIGRWWLPLAQMSKCAGKSGSTPIFDRPGREDKLSDYFGSARPYLPVLESASANP